MRPVSIEYFERLSFLAMMVGIAFTALSWNPAQAERLGVGPVFLPFVLAVCYVLLATLVLLISRKASLAAQILFLLLFAAGAVLADPGGSGDPHRRRDRAPPDRPDRASGRRHILPVHAGGAGLVPLEARRRGGERPGLTTLP